MRALGCTNRLWHADRSPVGCHAHVVLTVPLRSLRRTATPPSGVYPLRGTFLQNASLPDKSVLAPTTFDDPSGMCSRTLGVRAP